MPHSHEPDTMDDLCAAVRSFDGHRLLIWGDFVADRFLHGSTTRVSREAPALVLRYEGEQIRPGGAGNAALNAAALGAQVTACGFVGDDEAGAALRRALGDAGIDVANLETRTDGKTPIKTRVRSSVSTTRPPGHRPRRPTPLGSKSQPWRRTPTPF
jgi:bifunctional ADP-heptose synthase (sugar kinase/adenylyltransferase)